MNFTQINSPPFFLFSFFFLIFIFLSELLNVFSLSFYQGQFIFVLEALLRAYDGKSNSYFLSSLITTKAQDFLCGGAGTKTLRFDDEV